MRTFWAILGNYDHGSGEVRYRVGSPRELFDRCMRCRHRSRIVAIEQRVDRGQAYYRLARVENPGDLDDLDQACQRAWDRYRGDNSSPPGAWSNPQS